MFAGRGKWKGLLAAAGFASYSQTITTTGASTITKPVGATTCTVELIAAGSSGVNNFDDSGSGGGGGAYSKTNTYSLAGVTGIYIVIPAGNAGNAIARVNNSGGAVIAEADGTINDSAGGSAASGTGDVKYSGGSGSSGSVSSSYCRGGGAAGPTGNGGNATSGSAGAGGGSPAGFGGGSGSGGDYGGGGGVNSSGTVSAGGQGWCRLTWA